ncbi:hypothetical protein SAMN05892883_0531 [Jatrophihabitans sp. GAS493]|uniref:hypothetical protein n=1 Tax=Jatrophihabitans sp. GAS493 TaxID=1907575 RepID=UPI000BB73C4A|nr:hypothetical protein [Jatrophihabitans sp. GAS493]SOD70900.1 hypothetical protein SAMN05892883_0531 [Jatrophihabitans sp. GAS493]
MTARGSIRHAALLASVAILLGCLLTGCTSEKKSSAAQASATQPGAGTATITLDGSERTFEVQCEQRESSVHASGSAGPYALTVTMVGSPQSAVLVQTMSDGSRVISQAINDMRDEAGKAVGRISVNASGNEYTGTGTFVHTTIDSAGKRVETTGSKVSSGTFAVNCSKGFSTPVPTAAQSS